MKISMKIAPQKTGTFQGFGMKPGGSATSSSTAPGRPQGFELGPRGSAAAKAKAASGGVASLFRQNLDDDELEQEKKAVVLSWSKPSVEALKAQRHAEALQEADPTVFQYDEVIDDDKRAEGIEVSSTQQVRTNVLDQKKKVGLVLREGVEACRSGNKREAKYIEKVIITTDRRKVEQQIVEDRILQKQQDAREGREVFVTSGFKEELKRRKKFEDELEAQEARDQRRDASKKEDGSGFADFHRNMLNGGMASARGAEKIAEVKAVESIFTSVTGGTTSAPSEPSMKKEEEESDEDDKKEKQEPMKTEGAEETLEQHGVQDVQAASADPGTKAAKVLAEQEERAEKAMSAKERYLARKRAAET